MIRKLYPFLVIALASLQTASAISQYELENKPTQFQVAYKMCIRDSRNL